MAQPGEFFPQQFALGVLNIAANLKRQRDELAEMRSARAQRNFLKKERLELQEQGLALEAGQTQQAQELQKFQLELQKESFTSLLQERARKAQLEDSAAIEKATFDFENRGVAFVPSHARNLVKGLRPPDADFDIHETNIPGAGTVIQKIGGARNQQQLLSYQKLIADINKTQQEAAVASKRQEWYAARTATERAKLEGGATNVSSEDVTKALPYWNTFQNQIQKERSALESRITSFEFRGETGSKEYKEAKRRLEKIKKDPRNGLPENVRPVYDRVLTLLGVGEAQQEIALTTGRNPAPASTNFDEAKALGVDELIVGDPLDIALRTAGEANREGREVLSPNISFSETGRTQGTVEFHEHDGRIIPLNKQALLELKRNPRLQTMVHPRWREFWDKPAPRIQRPPAEPEPTPTETPAPVTDDSALAERLTQIESTLSAGNLPPDEAEALRAELDLIISQLSSTLQ